MADIPRRRIDTDAVIQWIRMVARSSAVDSANLAGFLNMGIVDNVLGWKDSSGNLVTSLASDAICLVTNSAPQSIPTSAETVLTYNTDVIDTLAMHNTSSNTNRITMTKAGVYAVGWWGQWGNGGGTHYTNLQNQAGTILCHHRLASPGVFQALSLATIQDFALNDWIEIEVFQSSGAPLDMGNSNRNFFWAFRIGD